MICILLDEHTDPAFNLAAEEYLLANCREDCFMIYRNDKAVIVGRNQNPLAQVNTRYVFAKKIPVIRRLSGGGAVYHDLGNVNFAFIRCRASGHRFDYDYFLDPISRHLQALGIPAKMDGGNSLFINGEKISGNAQYRRRERLLHHGTLLFDTDLNELHQALHVNRVKYRDKSVASIHSNVTNIRYHLNQPFSVEDFMERLFTALQRRYSARRILFSRADIDATEALARKRYRRWRWNFGASPPYSFQHAISNNGTRHQIQLYVVQGVIRKVRLNSTVLVPETTAKLEQALRGCRHHPDDINEALRRIVDQDPSITTMEIFKDRLLPHLF